MKKTIWLIILSFILASCGGGGETPESSVEDNQVTDDSVVDDSSSKLVERSIGTNLLEKFPSSTDVSVLSFPKTNDGSVFVSARSEGQQLGIYDNVSNEIIAPLYITLNDVDDSYVYINEKNIVDGLLSVLVTQSVITTKKFNEILISLSNTQEYLEFLGIVEDYIKSYEGEDITSYITSARKNIESFEVLVDKLHSLDSVTVSQRSFDFSHTRMASNNVDVVGISNQAHGVHVGEGKLELTNPKNLFYSVRYGELSLILDPMTESGPIISLPEGSSDIKYNANEGLAYYANQLLAICDAAGLFPIISANCTNEAILEVAQYPSYQEAVDSSDVSSMAEHGAYAIEASIIATTANISFEAAFKKVKNGSDSWRFLKALKKIISIYAWGDWVNKKWQRISAYQVFSHCLTYDLVNVTVTCNKIPPTPKVSVSSFYEVEPLSCQKIGIRFDGNGSTDDVDPVEGLIFEWKSSEDSAWIHPSSPMTPTSGQTLSNLFIYENCPEVVPIWLKVTDQANNSQVIFRELPVPYPFGGEWLYNDKFDTFKNIIVDHIGENLFISILGEETAIVFNTPHSLSTGITIIENGFYFGVNSDIPGFRHQYISTSASLVILNSEKYPGRHNIGFSFEADEHVTLLDESSFTVTGVLYDIDLTP